jgi:23S rRNA pseudouridine1911/1915/1917 synthase
MDPHRILYEDNHLIALNKAAGELVQGDASGDTPLCEQLKDYLKEKYHKPGNVFCGIIHRIDRPVSGVVLFARTSKTLGRMNEMIRNRHIRKTYLAIVGKRPDPPEDTLVHYLYRNEKQNRTYVSETAQDGYRRAELAYRLIGISDRYYLLEIDLKTGRHHQIRAQLSAIGLPIKGDLKYGAPRSNPDSSICLHAQCICFTHPVSGESIRICAPLPTLPLWNNFQLL